jgi:uncharacterized protein (UPF0248 family)
MGGRAVRELLNRLRWDAQAEAAAVELGVLVRGEDGERVEVVRFAEVAEILAEGVTLSGGTYIPYHRLRFVRQGGTPLWRARERRAGDEG